MYLVIAFWLGLLTGMIVIYAMLVPAGNKAINALITHNEQLKKRFVELDTRLKSVGDCAGGACCYDQPREREA